MDFLESPGAFGFDWVIALQAASLSSPLPPRVPQKGALAKGHGDLCPLPFPVDVPSRIPISLLSDPFLPPVGVS